MFTYNQETILNELVALYDFTTSEHCREGWEKQRNLLGGGLGNLLLDECQTSLPFMKSVLSIIQAAWVDKNLEMRKKAEKAGNLLHALYKNDPYMKEIIDKAIPKSPTVLKKLNESSEPGSFVRILYAAKCYEEMMSEPVAVRQTVTVTNSSISPLMQDKNEEKRTEKSAVEKFFTEHFSSPSLRSFWNEKDTSRITIQEIIKHALGGNKTGFFSGHSGADTKKALIKYGVDFKLLKDESKNIDEKIKHVTDKINSKPASTLKMKH